MAECIGLVLAPTQRCGRRQEKQPGLYDLEDMMWKCAHLTRGKIGAWSDNSVCLPGNLLSGSRTRDRHAGLSGTTLVPSSNDRYGLAVTQLFMNVVLKWASELLLRSAVLGLRHLLRTATYYEAERFAPTRPINDGRCDSQRTYLTFDVRLASSAAFVRTS